VAQAQLDLEALLDYLKRTRGFDFTGYKRASLERRIAKRMLMVGAITFADYLDYLEVHPEEFSGLFNTVLINVTHFFRDPSTGSSSPRAWCPISSRDMGMKRHFGSGARAAHRVKRLTPWQ